MNEKRKIKFRKFSDEYNIKTSKDFEKREYIHKITERYFIPTFIICLLLLCIGLVLLLDWLVVVVLILSSISIIILAISLIYSIINMNKSKKKWKEYTKKIESLKV